MHRSVCAAAAAVSVSGAAFADQVTLGALKDNTIFSELGLSGQALSNGSGQYFFAGMTATDDTRRGLLAFNVASFIPAGSTITGATLTLHMSRTVLGEVDVSLHRALANWGEGTSDASGQEGQGASATAGDATWTNRFHPGLPWATPGGAFSAAPSATTPVGEAFFFYSWSGAGLVADVQTWLDAPASDFGWFIIGDEVETASAKRFDSMENPNVDMRPSLTINFLIPAPSAAGVLGLAGIAATRRRRR